MNLRERQRAAIDKMLTIQHSAQSNIPGSFDANSSEICDQWKILVYDRECMDIISPLLNIGELRERGVTLHLLLDSKRDPVTDAPAIYFMRPSEDNIKRLIEDCSKNLYRNFHIHFLTRIDRSLLESFAKQIVAANVGHLITKVYDQYLDVITLEPSFFTLNIKNSFLEYNSPSMNDTQIHAFMNRVTMGLFSVFRMIGSIPYIRAAPNGAAEMLAQNFCNTLRENLHPRGPAYSLLAECNVSDRPRPLLLIFDRTQDMLPPLLHTSTYQALVDDLLQHRLNRVTVEVKSNAKANTNNNGNDNESSSIKKTYDMNTSLDNFFKEYAGAPFPEAVEANETQLAEVSRMEAEIRSRPNAENNAISVSQVMSGQTQSQQTKSGEQDLSQAISSLPEILAKKSNLETHTNILQNVMNVVASRDVPTYFEVEQKMLTGSSSDRTSIFNLLKDANKGGFDDKARLLLLSAILGEKVNYDHEFEVAFAQGVRGVTPPADQSAIDMVLGAAAFARRLQALQTPVSKQLMMEVGGSSSGLSSFLSTATTQASSLMAKAASLFQKFASLYVTQVVEAICEGRNCTENDSYISLDPRKPSTEIADFKSQRFSEVIVFMIGGGCYTEYFNLQELQKHKSTTSPLKSVIYGSTEVLNGASFLTQMYQLGAMK